MFLHPETLLHLAHLQHADRLREAEKARLVRSLRATRTATPRAWTRLVWRAGDWLVLFGYRLQGFQRCRCETTPRSATT